MQNFDAAQPAGLILAQYDPLTISKALKGEHPQVIALVLSFLDPQLAAKIIETFNDYLGSFDEHLGSEIFIRMRNLKKPNPIVVQIIESILMRQIEQVKNKSDFPIDLIKHMEPDISSKILTCLHKNHPEFVMNIFERLGDDCPEVKIL
jgi:flagellar motor switch protein FliG